MNGKLAAQAYRTLAEGYSLLALALEADNDTAGAVDGPPLASAPAIPSGAHEMMDQVARVLAPLPAVPSPAAGAYADTQPPPGRHFTQSSTAATAPNVVDTGGRCPSHDAEFRPGQYGHYCPAKGTEPAWTNRKGYCIITPENAGQWLAIHAAAR